MTGISIRLEHKKGGRISEVVVRRGSTVYIRYQTRKKFPFQFKEWFACTIFRNKCKVSLKMSFYFILGPLKGNFALS